MDCQNLLLIEWPGVDCLRLTWHKSPRQRAVVNALMCDSLLLSAACCGHRRDRNKTVFKIRGLFLRGKWALIKLPLQTANSLSFGLPSIPPKNIPTQTFAIHR